MARAYKKTYLNGAMRNLAVMMDCGVRKYGYSIDEFYDKFLSSKVSRQFGKGNPRYLVGMSGAELADMVVEASGRSISNDNDGTYTVGLEYWVGWVLAYYQWYCGFSFAFIQKNGLEVNTVRSLYPTLHEADLSKFVITADTIIQQHLDSKKSALKAIRKQARITQKQLADLSGVSLRMIQAYEQGDQDIRKAEAQTVLALSHILGCRPEVIC